MVISVVIPTYNRKTLLCTTLESLFNQNYPKDRYEIVVVDDSSTDGTKKMIEEVMKKKFPVRIKFCQQVKKGSAAARNLGVKNASGKIILFLGDDIEASECLIEEHITCHNRIGNNIACLGWIKWHKDLKITPFMKYISNIGPQFDINSLKEKPDDLSFKYFMTGNISVERTKIMEAGLFDEDFKFPAYEDSELGYRLRERGLKIILNPKAVAYHNHQIDLNDYCKRQFYVGRSAFIFHRKHPEIKRIEEIVRNKDGILHVLRSKYSSRVKLKEITKRVISNKSLIFFFEKIVYISLFLRIKFFYQFCFTIITRYWLVKGLLKQESDEKYKHNDS